jgi:hypothetical protein
MRWVFAVSDYCNHGPVSNAPPFSDCCSDGNSPAFVEPVARFATAGETHCVYQCPACRSSWWTAFNAAALDAEYEVAW